MSRIIQISEYFCIESIENEENSYQYLRYLGICSDLINTFTYFFKEKKFELAAKLVYFISPNSSLFEYIKQQITMESPIELHYILAKISENNNIVYWFKNIASKIWVLHNTQRIKRIDCLCLLQYSSLSCVSLEINDLDVLKSVIFSLKAGLKYLETCRDQNFAIQARDYIEKIEVFDIPDKFKKGFKENLDRLREKINNDYIDNTEKTKELNNQEIRILGKKLFKHKLPIIAPIEEIQRLLGIRSTFNSDNSYPSVLSALEEITAYIKKIA